MTTPGGTGPRRLWVGNAEQEFQRLRSTGRASLPHNPVLAQVEAKKIADTVTRGSPTDRVNRHMMAQFRRDRMASLRTGANVQMAMPRVRTPLGSLEDKNIPFNVEDPKELAECRRWARAFYITHDLIPLLIDIYARFPLVGLEFKSPDPLIEKFYTQHFMDDLDYGTWLPSSLGREYYISGEVTALAHFDETLGVFSGEEILNPDMVRVSKSMFVPELRVQLMVKETIDALRDGPADPNAETRSERQERIWQYKQIQRFYPEMIRAARQEDGLDISPALWSRIVNKPADWCERGAPFLLRSMQTLMQEQSLLAAQNSVADRLYAPMVLATLGLEDMGDGLPWIPEQADLDDLRDDMQNAFMADFKLVTHHMGLKVENVFGRESMPRFDQDFDRIDLKLMQAWGIGAALIMGGTAAGGTYASSALNREVCELLMKSFQGEVIKHIRKRMEVVAEAQEHYAFEKKGGYRRPLYREVVQYNEDGVREIVRVPELLIPDIEFRTLNLRDEAQERQFLIMLKESGFPISDRSLAINTPLQLDQEIPRAAEETVDKLVAQGEAMKKAQLICDEKGLPYPPELAQYLTQTLLLRQQLAMTKQTEDATKAQHDAIQQNSPAGQVGALPGYPALPPGPMGEEGDEGEGGPAGPAPMPAMPPPGPPMPPMGGGAMETPGAPPQLSLVGSHYHADMTPIHGPHSGGPGILPPDMEMPDDLGSGEILDPGPPEIIEPARNRARPAESDGMRGGMPRQGKRTRKGGIRPMAAIERGPSSYGSSKRVDPARVEAAIRRRELQANPPTVEELVNDPKSYDLTGMAAFSSQLMADFPEIMSGRDNESTEESKAILEELLDKYERQTGVRPRW